MTANIYAVFEERVRAIVADLKAGGRLDAACDPSRLTVEPPRDPSHGDLATNAAMVLAKPARMKPRDIAEMIAERLETSDNVVSAEIAGPGFINLRLTEDVWRGVVREAVAAEGAFGRSTMGGGEAVNVEYVSANPTGPLHVGHCRGAVFGDALARLLERAGYDVTREYYINDAGAQIETLARSAWLRTREALGEDIGEIPSGLYPGDYLKPVGEALARKYGNDLLGKPEEEWLPIVRDTAIDMMMDMIRDDLATLAIRHDVFFSERSLTGANGGPDRIGDLITALRGRDLVYEGRLPPPKGQPSEDWEDREQTLFRSTEFGDDIDRPLMKSNGDHTYFASDIAYHFDKFQRGFANQIDVWGADHGGYIKRMSAAVEAVSEGKAALDVKICQLVRLYRDGEPVKMSKRAGEFVTLRDVVDEVGADPVRFMMLYRKNDAPLDFDFAKVTEQSRDNPVFYVQYAHARIASVMRNAAEQLPGASLEPKSLAEADLSHLADEAEINVARGIALYPRIIESAARHHEPHRLAFYLYDLASDLHGLWNRGKDLPHLRFIQPDSVECTKARLALLCAVSYVLSSGLDVLGVSAPDEMT